MPTRRRLLGNALAAVLQVGITSASLFVLYLIVVRAVGVANLGMWSYAMAVFSLARITDLGIPLAITKLAAEAVVTDQRRMAGQLLGFGTLVVALGVGAGVTLVAAWMWLAPGSIGLPDRVRPLIVPLAVTTWCAAIGSALRAGLDSVQRADLRNHIMTGQALVWLLLAGWWVRRSGLEGLVLAQSVSAALGLLAGAVWIRRMGLPLIARPSREAFRRLLAFGMPFQVASVSCQLYDPAIKWLIGQGLGLASLGWYEMAARLVNQVRIVLVSAQEGLVPYIAALGRIRPDEVEPTYREASRLNGALAIAVFAPLVAAFPLVSRIWLGSVQPVFVWTGVVLCLGWWVNALVVPAYFAGQGTGLQRWNAWAHLGMLVFIVTTGWPAVGLGGLIGVTCAWTIGNILGSLGIVWGYHHHHHLPGRAWLERRHLGRYLLLMALAMLPVMDARSRVLGPRWVLALSGVISVLCLLAAAADPQIIQLFRRVRGSWSASHGPDDRR